ncbi:MAG: hypothetical protein IT462_09015 [Planctomycetes bacterium]|nr:hypothetical protein [Planctomycetota bacterium]
MLPLAAVKAADNVPTPEFTRGDVANLWLYVGIGVAFIVVLIALIMWYRHQVREQGNLTT